MNRNFGTLLDDGPATDTTHPVCQVAGCRAPASFRRRQNPFGQVDQPVYSERYCFPHVPASWGLGRGRR